MKETKSDPGSKTKINAAELVNDKYYECKTHTLLQLLKFFEIGSRIPISTVIVTNNVIFFPLAL